MVVASFDMNGRERFAFRNCIAEIVEGNLFGIPTTLGTRFSTSFDDLYVFFSNVK
jgi:hypothetical protein